MQKGQYGPGEFLNLTQKWRFGWLKLETGRPEMKKEKHQDARIIRKTRSFLKER
jgi:hypothetical protein